MHPVLHTHYYKRPYNGTLDLVTKCLLRMDIDIYPWSFFDDLSIYDSECHGAGAFVRHMAWLNGAPATLSGH